MNKTTKTAKTTPAKTATSTTNEATMTKIESATTTAPTQSTPSTASTPVIFQKAPPANALIPSPPSGFVPAPSSIFKGVLPRLVELGALRPIEDLKNFVDYATALGGTTAPPIAVVIAAFRLGQQWSSMRKVSAIWDRYAEMQEGIAWATIRPIMDQLRPAFVLAAARGPLPRDEVRKPGHAPHREAVDRQEGAATRALSRVAARGGKPPIHGKAGKARKKASDKAIVAAAKTASPTPATPADASVTPTPSAEAPVGPTPAAAPATSPAGSNGATH